MNFENFDPCFPDQPVVDLYLPVWANLPAFRSKPAFIWAEDGSADALTNGSFLTYSQLHNSAQFISQQLLTRLHRHDTVLILCSPGLELVQLVFGCQRAGLICVPIHPLKQNYHNAIALPLSQTNPKAIIAHQNFISAVQKDKKLASILQSVVLISTHEFKQSDFGSGFMSRPEFSYFSYNGCKTEEPYLIQYTSGATGISNPVVVSAGSAAHNVRAARKAYDLHPNSIIVSWLPQFHDCGLMFLLLTIVSGATCVLTSPTCFINQPLIWLQLISNFKATCSPVPSFTLPLVVKRYRRRRISSNSNEIVNLSSLKNLILINEPIYGSSVEEFMNVFGRFGFNPCCVSPSYGLAENCTFVSTSWKSKVEFDFAEMPIYKKLLPSARLGGRDVEEDEDVEIEIVVVNEETNEIVEDGVEGEIWVSSPSNASGYLANPTLTRQVFHRKLRNKPNHCFVRTGDRGVIKGKHRYLFVIGRSSDVIKLHNNQQIHPHYIETAAYNSCPHVLRGGCLAAVAISGTVAIVGELQREEDEEDVELMRKICEGIERAVVMEEGVGVGLVVLVKKGNVLKTTSGKIRRGAVKDKLAGGEMSVVVAVRFGENGGVLKSLKNTAFEETEAADFLKFQARPFLVSLL